jgi:hypothetical protein
MDQFQPIFHFGLSMAMFAVMAISKAYRPEDRVCFGAPAAQFQLQVYGYVVMPEHVHLLSSEQQEDTSSG